MPVVETRLSVVSKQTSRFSGNRSNWHLSFTSIDAAQGSHSRTRQADYFSIEYRYSPQASTKVNSPAAFDVSFLLRNTAAQLGPVSFQR